MPSSVHATFRPNVMGQARRERAAGVGRRPRARLAGAEGGVTAVTGPPRQLPLPICARESSARVGPQAMNCRRKTHGARGVVSQRLMPATVMPTGHGAVLKGGTVLLGTVLACQSLPETLVPVVPDR